MTIKDPDVFRIVEKIGDHFLNNVSNRFIRKALVVLELQQAEWDRLENLTNKSEYYLQQGFQFDELYEMVLAAAHFIHEARGKLMPNIKGMLALGSTDQERVLRLINELYLKVTALDRAAHEKKRPVYERITELKDLGRLLVNP